MDNETGKKIKVKISGVTQNDKCQIIAKKNMKLILNSVDDVIATICNLNVEDLFSFFNIQ